MSINKIVTKVDGIINKTINFNDLKSDLSAGSHTITVEAYNGATLVSTQTKNITVAAVSSYESETTSYMNAIAIPDNTSASAYSGKTNRDIWVIMDNYFKGLKTNSLLVKGVFDYPMIGGTAATNGVDALNPSNSLVWFGSWTHSINGSLGNGTNTYAKTGIIPSQTIMTDLAGGAFIASGTNNIPVGSDVYDMGAQNSAGSNLYSIRRNSGTDLTSGVVAKLYKEVLSPSPYYNALGIHGVNKNGGQVQLWRNAIKEGVTYASQEQRPTIENYIGAANLAGSPYGYSNQRFQGVVLQGGLTDAQVTEWMNLIDARELALGRKTW